MQPADAAAKTGLSTLGQATAVGVDACYWGIWGNGQPAGIWHRPVANGLTRIFTHWVSEMGLDRFMLDAPVDYLGSTSTAVITTLKATICTSNNWRGTCAGSSWTVHAWVAA